MFSFIFVTFKFDTFKFVTTYCNKKVSNTSYTKSNQDNETLAVWALGWRMLLVIWTVSSFSYSRQDASRRKQNITVCADEGLWCRFIREFFSFLVEFARIYMAWNNKLLNLKKNDEIVELWEWRCCSFESIFGVNAELKGCLWIDWMKEWMNDKMNDW